MKGRAGASSATAPVAFAILLLPRLAQACPMCANQQPGGVARIVALGVMLLLPFTIAFILFGALRRAGVFTTRKDSKARTATDAGSDRAGSLREMKQ